MRRLMAQAPLALPAPRAMIDPVNIQPKTPSFRKACAAKRRGGMAFWTLGTIMKFGVGQPVRRFEDQTLITGKGRYTDDITLPNMAQAVVVRAQAAHANIRRIDATAARSMPGVLLVLTGDDVKADGLGDVPCHAPLNNRDGSPRHDTPRPALAIGKVRHVGQPVAFVVAETLAAGAGRRRGDRDRLRDAARRHRRARRAGAGRAAAVRRHPGQSGVRLGQRHLGLRRDRRGLRQGRARHHAGDRQQPRGRRTRWSRATRSATGMRRRSARCSTPARRARTSCAIRSPKRC